LSQKIDSHAHIDLKLFLCQVESTNRFR